MVSREGQHELGVARSGNTVQEPAAGVLRQRQRCSTSTSTDAAQPQLGKQRQRACLSWKLGRATRVCSYTLDGTTGTHCSMGQEGQGSLCSASRLCIYSLKRSLKRSRPL